MIFRQINADDIPALLDVRQSTGENAMTPQELERDYGITPISLAVALKTSIKGWLCEVSGKVVGFAMGDSSNGEVQVVAVLPEYEGRGIGSKLMMLVQDWLFTSGLEEIWLRAVADPGTRAWGFYRTLGWKSTGQRFDDEEILYLRNPGL